MYAFGVRSVYKKRQVTLEDLRAVQFVPVAQVKARSAEVLGMLNLIATKRETQQR